MKYFWLIFSLLLTTSVYSQSSRIKSLENQRKNTLAEIEAINQLLNETERTTATSLNRLNLISKKLLSRKKLINLLNQEIGEIDRQISNHNNDIDILEKEVNIRKENYTKSIRSAYNRRSSQDKLLFIFSADDFAQSMRRFRYLKEYADWQKKQAKEILSKQEEIKKKKALLTSTRTEKNKLLASREQENRQLQTEESHQKKEVQQLQKKKGRLQTDLRKKQRQADELNRLIEAQIIAEMEQSQKSSTKDSEKRVAASKGGYAMTKVERKLSDDFATNKGRLPYPVNSQQHTIVNSFGEQQHEDLKYVKLVNNGIDIQTPPGTSACSIFNGVVTRVFVVPGYNNSVIVRHGNYLTVYSNLSEVYVKAGEQVKTHQILGKIFTDTKTGNTTILQFQLWKEKTKLNPATWLD